MRIARKHAIELYLSVATNSDKTISIIEELQKDNRARLSSIACKFGVTRQYVSKVHLKFIEG